jgi:6-phosphogluconolactonase
MSPREWAEPENDEMPTIRRMHETIVSPDPETTARTVRDWFVDRCRDTVSARGRCLVALSGGSTPKRLYELLAELPDLAIDWSKVILIWGDERDVPEDHADSNYRMVRHALLDRLGQRQPTIHRIPTGSLSADDAANAYEKTLKQVIGVSDPAIDIVFLGLGDDAHTASLFPETTAIEVCDRWCVSNEVPKLNTTRITLTAPLLNNASHVAFLVCGANKRWALDKIHGSERNSALYPAQLIQPSGTLWWFLDQAAHTG